MALFGAPVLMNSAVDLALQNKVNDLHRTVGRLALLHSHDASVPLRNSLEMPKLLYTLRTSPRADDKLFSVFDSTLRQGLTTMLNIDLTDDQWIQASFAIRKRRTWSQECTNAGIIRLLASAAFTLSRQNDILLPSLADCEDVDISAELSSWRSLSNSEQPPQQSRTVQKAWDGIIASVVQARLLSRVESPLDQARLLSACAEHSGDWLHAPPH